MVHNVQALIAHHLAQVDSPEHLGELLEHILFADQVLLHIGKLHQHLIGRGGLLLHLIKINLKLLDPDFQSVTLRSDNTHGQVSEAVDHPLQGRYLLVKLTYLPVGVTQKLREVLPVGLQFFKLLQALVILSLRLGQSRRHLRTDIASHGTGRHAGPGFTHDRCLDLLRRHLVERIEQSPGAVQLHIDFTQLFGPARANLLKHHHVVGGAKIGNPIPKTLNFYVQRRQLVSERFKSGLRGLLTQLTLPIQIGLHDLIEVDLDQCRVLSGGRQGQGLVAKAVTGAEIKHLRIRVERQPLLPFLFDFRVFLDELIHGAHLNQPAFEHLALGTHEVLNFIRNQFLGNRHPLGHHHLALRLEGGRRHRHINQTGGNTQNNAQNHHPPMFFQQYLIAVYPRHHHAGDGKTVLLHLRLQASDISGPLGVYFSRIHVTLCS